MRSEMSHKALNLPLDNDELNKSIDKNVETDRASEVSTFNYRTRAKKRVKISSLITF